MFNEPFGFVTHSIDVEFMLDDSRQLGIITTIFQREISINNAAILGGK